MPQVNSDMPMQALALLKRFALNYLPIVLVLSIILLSGIRFDQQLRVKSTLVREESRIEIARDRVTHDLSTIDTDLRVIANLHSLHEYLDSGNPVQREELEQFFLNLARETHRYDQMRYFNSRGQEVIRINYNDGKPAIVPRKQLQNKLGRYYFSDTISLKQGEIFVSPLDLNVEHGNLEIPYKPVIRYGTPVFDSAGRKKGIILLNYLGDELLQNFRAAMQSDNPHSGVLVNRDGYWLSGVNREDEWGFMLGRNERTFGHDYPEVWRAISAAEQGSLLTDQGLYVYTTVYPMLDEQRSSTGSSLANSHSQHELKAHEYYWKIVSFVPQATLSGNAFYNQTFGRILLVVVYLLLALAAFIVARVVLGRKLAKQEIIKLNIALEKRVAEHAAGEENLSVTLRSIGDGVMTTDTEGRVTRLNTIAEQLTGWSQKEAAGRPVAEVFHIINQKTRQPALVPVEATLKEGVIHELAEDTLLIARDGSMCSITDSCAPIRNRDGVVIGAVLVFHDVTREYAAQVALRDSATYIQTILDTVVDGIITINEHGIIEIFNPAAEGLFGYTSAEVIGKNINILMPEPHHSQHDGYLAHYRTTGKARVIGAGREVEGQRKNGSTFPMYLTVTEMQFDGQRKFTGILHDFTERKQTEQRLTTAKEQAERANRTKDSFLATMSHEIRTPLTGILGMLEMLSLTPLDQGQTKTLNAAWSSGRSLLRIVSDILDWSKIEDGKLALAPHATEIPQLLQEVVNTYSRVASAKGLLLWQHADARLSPTHIVDPLRLSQVLNNFVSNALKFTEHGEVELGAELLETVDSGERIKFSVKDTGIGIDKEAQQHLFQRYRQASSDTARMYGGTGLGLSICKRLVDLMDGQIELASEPGQGAVFSITLVLPITAMPSDALQAQHPEVEHRTIHPLFDHDADAPPVLVVDDHPINRDLLARQITLLGLRAETAENGSVALPKWREGRFALVITDCHMPEMDGYALSRAIRKIEADERRSRTPIIAWTANALPEEVSHCQAAGMDDLLVKPAGLPRLRKMLAKMLHIAEIDGTQAAPDQHEADADPITGPIDHEHLKQIVPDSTEQIKVLHDFQSHIRTNLNELMEILKQGAPANAERMAHRMKGSSRMVGATEIADVCEMLENAAKQNNMDSVHAGMTGLIDAIKRFETYLVDIVKNQERADESR